MSAWPKEIIVYKSDVDDEGEWIYGVAHDIAEIPYEQRDEEVATYTLTSKHVYRIKLEFEDPMTREEHLDWCKKRALEYLDDGSVADAITSLMSDMAKHPETKNNNMFLDAMGLIVAASDDIEAARRYIVGFR